MSAGLLISDGVVGSGSNDGMRRREKSALLFDRGHGATHRARLGRLRDTQSLSLVGYTGAHIVFDRIDG